MKRICLVIAATSVSIGVSACSGTGLLSIGDDGKAPVAAKDVVPAGNTACAGETKHPSICCQGEACFSWLDDPFRPCEPGYTNVGDGTKCCSPDNPQACSPPPRPQGCSPDNPKACAPPIAEPAPGCSPNNPASCGPEPGVPLPPPADLCTPTNPSACNLGPGDEPATCFTFDGGAFVKVDILSGAVSKIADVKGALGDLSSFGMVDDTALFCDGTGKGGGVYRVRLSGQTHTVEPVAPNMPCDALTADEQGIWILSIFDLTLRRYPNVAAIVSDTPAATYMAPQNTERLGPSPNELVTAWHSSAFVSRYSRESGTSTQVPLDGYDGWIWGVSAARGGRIVVSSPNGLGGSGTLHVFDQNGKHLRKVGLAVGTLGYQGLVCEYQGSTPAPTPAPSP